MNVELSDYEARVIRAALAGSIMVVLQTETTSPLARVAVADQLQELSDRLDG